MNIHYTRLFESIGWFSSVAIEINITDYNHNFIFFILQTWTENNRKYQSVLCIVEIIIIL